MIAAMKQPLVERRGPQLGLSANWRQFSLLVIVNGFVGAMVGLERAVLPIVAVNEFAVGSTAAVLSFRDLGYVAGALVAGAIADAFGVAAAIGVMTAMSGVIFGIRFREVAVAGVP
jgi:hypothetical protein